jgi:hypothetical protein
LSSHYHLSQVLTLRVSQEFLFGIFVGILIAPVGIFIAPVAIFIAP